jgi:predicted RND superfamily exporter protein
MVGVTQLEFDDDPRSLYLGDDDASRQLQNFYEEFGADDQDILLVLRAADVFQPEVMNAGRDLWLAAAEVEGIERVFSIYSLRRRGKLLIPLIPRREAAPERYADAKRMALEHPLAADHLVSADATALLLIARLAGEPESIAKLKQPVAALQKLAREASEIPGVEVLVTGHPTLRIDILSALAADLFTFVGASAAVALLVAWWVFGRWAAVLMVVLTPTFGVLWIVSVMPAMGLKLNGVNAVLPTLVYAIGVTDAVHLVIGLRRRLAAGMPRRMAVRAMLAALALPCFLTSLTTAIGFGSLGLAHEPIIRQFGLICAAGTLMNFAAVMTVMPLLMLTPLAAHLMPKGRCEAEVPNDQWLNLLPLVRFVEQRPKAIVATAFAGSAVMLALSLKLGPDFSVTEVIPDSNPSVLALETLDATMGGGMLGYVVVTWPENMTIADSPVLETVQQVHEAIAAEPEFCGAFSVRNLLQAGGSADSPLERSIDLLEVVPEDELHRLLDLDQRRLVVSFHIQNMGAAELAPAFARLESRLAALAAARPGWELHLTGTLPVVARNLWSMIGDLGRSLSASTLLVFAVIGLTLRSWKLGLISLLPNVLPLLVTSIVLVACGEPLRIVTVVSYSLCLGIAVDDTIHFLVHFQRENRVQPVGRAIEDALQTAGVGIVTSSLILLGGFSVMLLSHMPSIRWLALMCDVAMLSALAAVLVILPALLLCFWSPRQGEPLRR